MPEGGGRWVLVTFDLPSRSKAQRSEAARFQRWLIGVGYARIHGSAYGRYLPPRAKVTTETNRLRGALPPQGVVYVVELTEALHRRALMITDGDADAASPVPETLTVY